MRAANTSQERAQANWRHYPATLLAPVPGPNEIDHGANSWIAWAPAVWTVGGVKHHGEIPAEAGSRAHSVATVWLDSHGKIRMPPLTPGQAGSRILEARAGGLAVLAVALAIMLMFARRMLDRLRLKGWENAWLHVGPTWSRHR